MLEAQALTLERDRQRLVDSIDLKLTLDKLTVILGFNGAGKSLLLRLLHGLLQPTGGKVLWDGEPLSEANQKTQAMVFQKPVLLRRSTAANIDFALKTRGITDTVRREELLRRVDLQDLARRPARLLSGGEQQRLALARALACEPKVLFLDEPTASLDPASTAMIEEIVQTSQAQGTKVIFVTHDIGQAKRIADEVVFLHQGKMAQHSPAKTFFAKPSSDAARAYLEGKLIS